MLDPSVLEWVASSTPEKSFMLKLAEVRLAIEPGMAGIAARNATEEDIENITTAYDQLEAAQGDELAWAKADLAFHASIVDACKNEFLTYIVRAIRKPLYSRRLINASLATLLGPEDVVEPYESVRDEVLSRHQAVVKAIQQRDDEAAELATDRLLKRVTELMRRDQAE
jgi:DNA-binding FadR family transcriptional regulator